MKTKVLLIITKKDIGGAQKYASDLKNNLDKNRFETKTLYGGCDLKWLSNAVNPWTFFINDWLAIFELVKIYKQERPDIVHLNSSKTGVLGSLAAFFYKILYPKPSTLYPKIIFTAHGWVFNPTNALSWPARWFYIWLHKLAALFQDKIICVSEYDYQLALNYHIAPKTKLETIHNGINTDIEFLNKEAARKELLQGIRYRVQGLEKFNKSLTPKPLTLNPTWPWVGSIGRLVKEKNYETFIQAASLVPNAYFFIIGSGPEEKKLKAKSSQLKADLFFIEPTGNDSQYLKAFDIFVMSSVKEGLPYILLEAMTAGLPAVVTEAGGVPEMIKNHENGLMVAPKKPEMLAKAIQGLIANPAIATALGEMAKKAIQEKFSLNKMISKTEEVYCALL
jgi:glycosyltransferase involved in cell wall biosynthesis